MYLSYLLVPDYLGAERRTLEELQRELEDQRELAQNRYGTSVSDPEPIHADPDLTFCLDTDLYPALDLAKL